MRFFDEMVHIIETPVTVSIQLVPVSVASLPETLVLAEANTSMFSKGTTTGKFVF